MSFNKKFFTTGGIVASTPSAPAGLDPLQNFETVTYTGNGGTQKITGYIRKGASFNGSSSTIATSAKIPFSLDFSFSFWFNTTSTYTNGYIFSTKEDSQTNGYYIMANNGVIQYGEGDGTNNATTQYSTTTDLNDGNWHHCVVTRAAGGTLNMYIDNIREVNNASLGTGYMTSANWHNNLRIGRYSGVHPSGLYYNGKIDQVRIFDKALNSTEVGELALETYADPKKSTTDYFGDGSGVALYELDEDAGDTGVPIDSGQSAVFNGSSSKINTGVTNAFDLQTFSVSAWINLNNSSSQAFVCNFGTDSQPNGLGWAFRINGSGQLLFADAYGAGVAGSVLATNTWIHVVSVCNVSTGEQTIYLNGQQDATRNNYSGIAYVAGGFPAGSRRLTIGELGGNNVAWLNGKIDQVRIYSSALSASDVEALASETNVPTANLVAHYKLDGDATDETTNYNGTWGGTEAYSDPAVIAYNGTPTNINFLGMAFQPDLVWIKERTSTSGHFISDSIRGATKVIYSNLTNSEDTETTVLTSFDTNGFTVGSSGGVNAGTDNYVAWCWKAADTTTTIAANTVGNTIASDVRANTEAGFSIVKYSGTNTVSDTVGHGLSSPPEMVIIKNISATKSWAVRHADLDSTKNLFLNATNQATTITATSSGGVGVINSTTVGFASGGTDASNVNISGNDFIAYCFHSVDGYQKVGSYEGNGSTSGATVTTGFMPRFLLLKNADRGDFNYDYWQIFDYAREDKVLYPNTSNDEDAFAAVDFLSDGFQIVSSSQVINHNGSTYIYLAIA